MPRAKEPTAARIIRDRYWTDSPDSVDMPIRLLHSTEVTPRGKVIYMALRYNAAERDDFLVASGDQRHFAQDAGLTLKTFANGLAELERHNWIVILRPNEDEKVVTLNDLETKFKVQRTPGGINPTTPKHRRTVWGNVYFLLERLVGDPSERLIRDPNMSTRIEQGHAR